MKFILMISFSCSAKWIALGGWESAIGDISLTFHWSWSSWTVRMRGTQPASPLGGQLCVSDWLAKLLCNPQKDGKGQRKPALRWLFLICSFWKEVTATWKDKAGTGVSLPRWPNPLCSECVLENRVIPTKHTKRIRWNFHLIRDLNGWL